jgi:uncharacterized protein
MLGALGGLGGAVLLVPVLVVGGVAPADAAPLGLLTVAAGSLAAAPRQLAERVVHHRLGLLTELAASSGAVVGAFGLGLIDDDVLIFVLAAVATAAGSLMLVPTAHEPAASAADAELGEQIGSLTAILSDRGAPVRVTPKRVPMTLAAMGGAGLVAGLTGASGGFLKTPALTHIMGVPLRVAAATTTFTVGITAAAGLLVQVARGHLQLDGTAEVVLGSLAGGAVGARFQSRLPDTAIRRLLAGLLFAVALTLVLS